MVSVVSARAAISRKVSVSVLCTKCRRLYFRRRLRADASQARPVFALGCRTSAKWSGAGMDRICMPTPLTTSPVSSLYRYMRYRRSSRGVRMRLSAVCLRISHKAISDVRICSDHFKPQDFEYDARLSAEFGVRWKRRRLRKNAVPCVKAPRMSGTSRQSVGSILSFLVPGHLAGRFALAIAWVF